MVKIIFEDNQILVLEKPAGMVVNRQYPEFNKLDYGCRCRKVR